MNSAQFDFVLKDGTEVKATRYVNPDGKIGGWVAVNAKIQPGAIIEPGAVVAPGASVGPGELVKNGEIKT